jgi:hypothetical protein
MLVLLAACDKESNDGYPVKYKTEDITKLELYADATRLLANGRDELVFSIDAYYKVDKTIVRDKEIYDTTYVDFEEKIKVGNLPAGVEIFTTEGEPIEGWSYSTTKVEPEEIGFYARIKTVISDTVFIRIVKTPEKS